MNEQRDAAVNRCLDYLFTNGFKQKAERLVLTSANGQDLGGWGRPALRDVIAKVFDAALEAGKWVPVRTADDLPKEDGKYLWTCNFGGVRSVRKIQLLTVRQKRQVGGSDFSLDGEILAWMPLPEPFSGGTQ